MSTVAVVCEAGRCRWLALALSGVAFLACGRSVVIQDGAPAAAGGGGAGGLGAAGGVVAGGPSGWAGAGPGPCVSCSEWLAGCGGARPCTNPSAACPGEAREQVDELVQCVCAGCVEACESCVMFDAKDPSCRECQLGALTEGCLYEHGWCMGPPD